MLSNTGTYQIQMLVYVYIETLYWGDTALSTKPVMHSQGTAYLCY